MYYQGWNDFELLYLIKEGNHLALNLMYLKYEKFIRITARNCGFPAYMHDDCVQEGHLMLRDAIRTFNTNYRKSFTKYFELILLRKFWRLRKQTMKHEHVYIDNQNLLCDNHRFYENIQTYKLFLTEEESHIFEQVYYYRNSVKRIAEQMGVKIHYIYKKIRKIREKLLLEFDL